jgi:membrane-associated protease RseP (regulator of RpoE activity)
MHKNMLKRRWVVFSAVAFIGLVLSARSQADDAQADIPKPAPAVGNGDANQYVESVVDLGVNLSNTQFALEAIHLAANNDWLGAEVAQVDDVLRSHLTLGEGKGLLVTSMNADGPAAAAGIQKCDVLTTVGDQEIADLEAFRKSLEASADKPIAVGLIRAGKRLSVDVTPRSTVAGLLFHGMNESVTESRFWLGLGLTGADDTLRSQLSVPAGEGLVVTGLENDSPAAKAGVMVNDVLLKLDGKALTTVEALAEQLQAIGDKSVPLELLRRGKPAMLTVTPERHADPAALAIHWLTLNQGANEFWTSAAFTQFAAAAPAMPNVAEQPVSHDLHTRQLQELNNLESQIKQLQAALSALRNAIEPPAQPTTTGEEKK